MRKGNWCTQWTFHHRTAQCTAKIQSKSHTDIGPNGRSLAILRQNGMWKSCSHNECLSDQVDLLTAIRSAFVIFAEALPQGVKGGNFLAILFSAPYKLSNSAHSSLLCICFAWPSVRWLFYNFIKINIFSPNSQGYWGVPNASFWRLLFWDTCRRFTGFVWSKLVILAMLYKAHAKKKVASCPPHVGRWRSLTPAAWKLPKLLTLPHNKRVLQAGFYESVSTQSASSPLMWLNVLG